MNFPVKAFDNYAHKLLQRLLAMTERSTTGGMRVSVAPQIPGRTFLAGHIQHFRDASLFAERNGIASDLRYGIEVCMDYRRHSRKPYSLDVRRGIDNARLLAYRDSIFNMTHEHILYRLHNCIRGRPVGAYSTFADALTYQLGCAFKLASRRRLGDG